MFCGSFDCLAVFCASKQSTTAVIAPLLVEPVMPPPLVALVAPPSAGPIVAISLDNVEEDDDMDVNDNDDGVLPPFPPMVPPIAPFRLLLPEPIVVAVLVNFALAMGWLMSSMPP